MAARVQTLKDLIIEQEESKKQASLSKEKALRECKHIEEEMADFHDNKDTKLDEMTVIHIHSYNIHHTYRSLYNSSMLKN